MGSTTTAPVQPLTAHLTTAAPSMPDHHVDHQQIHLGRDKVHWDPAVWKRIDEAVIHEVHRASVAPRFMNNKRVRHNVTNIEADVVLSNLSAAAGAFTLAKIAPGTSFLLNVSENAQLPVIELSLDVALSQAQVHKENDLKESPTNHVPSDGAAESPAPGHPSLAVSHGHHEHHLSSTAVMLVRRAANVLALARDTVVFMGANAFLPINQGGSPLFASGLVVNRGTPQDTGLTGVGNAYPNTQVTQAVQVNPSNAGGAGVLAQYSSATVAAISQAYSTLNGNGYAGPFACVLPSYDFADACAPLQNTLVTPADRVRELLERGFYASAALPGSPNPQNPSTAGNNPLGGLTYPAAQAVGFVVSLGGDVV